MSAPLMFPPEDQRQKADAEKTRAIEAQRQALVQRVRDRGALIVLGAVLVIVLIVALSGCINPFAPLRQAPPCEITVWTTLYEQGTGYVLVTDSVTYSEACDA